MHVYVLILVALLFTENQIFIEKNREQLSE